MKRSVLIIFFGVAVYSTLFSLKIFAEYHLTSYYFLGFFGGLFGLVGLFFFIKIPKENKTIQLDWMDMLILFYSSFIIIDSLFINSFLTKPVFSWLLILPVYFILKYNLNRSHRNTIDWILLLSGAIECLVAVLQLTGLVKNIDSNYLLGGTFGNPNVMAIYLVLLTPICVSFMLDGDFQRRHRAGAFILLVVFVIFIFISECRAAILGLFVIAFIICLFKINDKFFKIAIVVLFVTAIPLFIFYYQHKKDSADGRLLIWEVSLGIIKDKPFRGHGYGNFEKIYNNAQAAYFAAHRDEKEKAWLAGHVTTAFNEFLEEWIEGGILGLVIFAGIFASVALFAYKGLKNSRQDSHAVVVTSIAAILCFAAISLVNYSLTIIPATIVFICYLSNLPFKLKTTVSLSIFTKKLILSGILILIFLISFKLSREGYYQIQYKKANGYLADQKYAEAGFLYKECYPYLKDYGRFLYDYSAYIARHGDYHKSLELLRKATDYTSHYQLYSALG